MKRSHFTREIVEIIAFTLVLFIVIRFVIHGYAMHNNTNMQPSVSSNAYIMVNRTSYLFKKPDRGDVVVLHYPSNPNTDVVARIIGLPGDTIRTNSTHVTVNGTTLVEPYVQTPFNPEAREWKVAPNTYFLLNDNRQIADDSRNWGSVNKDMIVGKAVINFWPLSQFGFINNHSDTFAQVKNPAP
ncbi:signal peptidase I [Dictyobacter arantiisoli]|uniref:Signal peptidase I n=1 Tax=Dictyobacter arantiisoli TaxID=2014874 RepID=A0A5A5TIF0_9CHLR|nr:signal peptidase I [Dictyobacter arantiisoli]GCF10978.1 signal peptidase I [Dictyobacter arantiisoli]